MLQALFLTELIEINSAIHYFKNSTNNRKVNAVMKFTRNQNYWYNRTSTYANRNLRVVRKFVTLERIKPQNAL